MALERLTVEEHAQRVADYLPGGRIFQSKNAPTPQREGSTGRARAASATSLTLAANASKSNGAFNGMQLRLVGGSGGNQQREIASYIDQLATVVSRWSTNLATHSDDFFDASYTRTGPLDVAIDGSFHTITDTSITLHCGMYKDITIADDSEVHVTSLEIKKTSGGTAHTVAINVSLYYGGTPVSSHIYLNTDTGAYINESPGGMPLAQDVGDAWRVFVLTTNNSTGNTLLRATVYPAIAPYGSSSNDVTLTGGNGIRKLQIEKYPSASAYVKTNSAPVTLPDSSTLYEVVIPATVGSNIRKLINGIAFELFTAEGYIRDFQDDIAPSVTIYFLDEWERALGIPDQCFTGEGTMDERRRDIILKLAALGAQTATDFEEIAALFGITVTVSSAVPLSAIPPFDVMTTKELKFTIAVQFSVTAAERFPLVFPFTFGDSLIALLECIFRRLIPANCNAVFIQV